MKENITPHNAKKQKHGRWVTYTWKDTIFFRGTFINDKQIGLHEYNFESNALNEKTFYII